jgi:hypothetical protein
MGDLSRGEEGRGAEERRSGGEKEQWREGAEERRSGGEKEQWREGAVERRSSGEVV